MSQQYKAVAALLKNNIAAINEILSDPNDELHRLSVTGDLQRTHDKLLLLTGTGDLETGKSTVLGPAKTIGGVPIGKQRKFTEADLVPSDDKVFQLKKEIESALFYFGPDASAEGILANIPELIIRGVAKKAGLKVTKDEPKEITVEFIEDIKLALGNLKFPEMTDEEKADFVEKMNKAKQGGISMVAVLSPDDIGQPMGEGVVTIDDPKPSDTEAKEAFEGILSNLKERQATEESSVLNDPAMQAAPKQDTKSDAKKKAGK